MEIAWVSPFFKIMKLNDLPPLDQAEIIANRIANMDALREHALKSRNPIELMTIELDAQARLMGLNMDYCEELDDDEYDQ